MKSLIFAAIVASSAIITNTASAAPPAGHPTPQVAAEMLAPARVAPSELPNEGRVLNVLQAGEYTYLEVSNGNNSRWLAAPQTVLQNGALVRYEEGSTMSTFYSKLLKRNFSNLMFIGQLAVVSGK